MRIRQSGKAEHNPVPDRRYGMARHIRFIWRRGIPVQHQTRQDITERNDLSDSNPEKLQEMADALSAKLKGYDALMPTFRSTGDIVPMPDELAGRTAICPSDIQPTSQGH